jgi:hypothetical protein
MQYQISRQSFHLTTFDGKSSLRHAAEIIAPIDRRLAVAAAGVALERATTAS